jgi:hypothetical protein
MYSRLFSKRQRDTRNVDQKEPDVRAWLLIGAVPCILRWSSAGQSSMPQQAQ